MEEIFIIIFLLIGLSLPFVLVYLIIKSNEKIMVEEINKRREKGELVCYKYKSYGDSYERWEIAKHNEFHYYRTIGLNENISNYISYYYPQINYTILLHRYNSIYYNYIKIMSKHYGDTVAFLEIPYKNPFKGKYLQSVKNISIKHMVSLNLAKRIYNDTLNGYKIFLFDNYYIRSKNPNKANKDFGFFCVHNDGGFYMNKEKYNIKFDKNKKLLFNEIKVKEKIIKNKKSNK
jgi:hypothetical protein